MTLFAISDLHLTHEANRHAIKAVKPHPNDWLIIAGDVGEKDVHLQYALEIFTRAFEKVIWVPGNHDLWTIPNDPDGLRGVARYEHLVSICRQYHVLTPEDPFPIWSDSGSSYRIAPLFMLYDYSFRPSSIPLEGALEWAAEKEIVCVDEYVLHPDPYPTRSDWCRARVQYSQQRLQALPHDHPLIIINHWPLRYDLVNLPRIPRFSLWCGTTQTENFHLDYPVATVVYGHLHMRGTFFRDGVCFEEVSLGYPRHWDQNRPLEDYLRVIAP